MESLKKYILVISLLCLVICTISVKADKPCAPRSVTGESVVCVCNSTYCDEVTRQIPTQKKYIAYTSSKDGLRFHKTTGDLVLSNSKKYNTNVLKIDINTAIQTIKGFGGAVTDAAGINWKSLPETVQKYLVDSYFSDKGLEYNMIRVPIGGSDFSTHPYAYNEIPKHDTELSNYSLTAEDYKYKIPMIKSCMASAKTDVHVVATTWSPPLWMKTNGKISGFSRLKPEYFQTYADYHYKFIDKYAAEKIPIWAITTTNEPINGVIPIPSFNSLGWSPSSMGQWIANNLGPTIKNSTYKNVKILAVDDQRYTLPLWFTKMIKEHPKALDWIDGVAVHYYGDLFTPSSVLELVTEKHPDKFVINTEACTGSFPWELRKVILGSWSRAERYIKDIMSDLNNKLVGWIDWNMCLDEQGGPNWDKNFVDSPIIVLPQNKEFVKQPMFYALGHFSKFIPRGSKRIQTKELKSEMSSSIPYVAFLTPNDTVVVVAYNSAKSAKHLGIKLGDLNVSIQMRSKSVTTIEMLATN